MNNRFYYACGLMALAFLAACKTTAPRVRMDTDAGTIVVEVYPDKAPITAQNFLRYVDERRFDGAAFYRVVRLDNQPTSPVKIEVIQGGLDSTHRDRRLPAIEQETTNRTGLRHVDGAISMARREPNSGASEFFICINNQPELDFGGKRNPDGNGFAAFGRVVKGMDVVRRIQQGQTGQGERGQALVKIVLINKMERARR
ncbi:MAG: peptidylprolyl isomerase [Bernardetiaceae bacterium]|jgi:peptidyl-prolyl cis-trans isomerase A (cyclophilin A)|nr:peptidylprolyl isomerase [Bernardetiaceae bacterium]